MFLKAKFRKNTFNIKIVFERKIFKIFQKLKKKNTCNIQKSFVMFFEETFINDSSKNTSRENILLKVL